MTKIKFRTPSTYDLAVAKTGVPFTYVDADGITWGTFIVSLFNLDSKFVRIALERFARENKEVVEKLEGEYVRGVFTFVNVCLHGWDIVDENGKPVPFTRQNAFDYFEAIDDQTMFNALVEFAQDKSNFKHDPRATKDEEAKN